MSEELTSSPITRTNQSIISASIMTAKKVQPYYTATKELIDFMNSPKFPHNGNAAIGFASKLSARTVAGIFNMKGVSGKTAKAIYKLCVELGFVGSFESAFQAK